jgi:predicted PurR-regulated permease PerM
LGHPFRWGFLVTIGALVAIALATTLASLSTVLISIGVALFIALALDPVVRWLQRHGLSRGISILIVFLAFALIFGGLLSWLIPVAITQIVELAGAFPSYFESLQTAEWYIRLEEYLGQGKDVYSGMLDQAAAWLANPANLLTLGGGAVAVGTGAVNALSGSLIVLVLTLYFLASLNAMKKALYSLVPAHGRARFTALTEQITESVGSYVGGMVILAACNALFAFLLLTFLGVPFAPLLGFVALLITMIPMIGPFLFLITATIIALFTSPWTTALIFALVYFAYMEVEAYVLTPKVMNRAVNVPGALVLIGAMVGASLLGLLGALVAVPITASILIVVRQVVIPRQDAKVIRPAD